MLVHQDWFARLLLHLPARDVNKNYHIAFFDE